MPKNCASAAAVINPPKIFHPPCLFTLPPAMMIRNPTMAASSATVAKLMRKPVLRHMGQKELRSWSWQRAGSGNGAHVFVVDVQRRWRPMVSKTLPPAGLDTVYETHLGVVMEVRVMAVAGGVSILFYSCRAGWCIGTRSSVVWLCERGNRRKDQEIPTMQVNDAFSQNRN